MQGLPPSGHGPHWQMGLQTAQWAPLSPHHSATSGPCPVCQELRSSPPPHRLHVTHALGQRVSRREYPHRSVFESLVLLFLFPPLSPPAQQGFLCGYGPYCSPSSLTHIPTERHTHTQCSSCLTQAILPTDFSASPLSSTVLPRTPHPLVRVYQNPAHHRSQGCRLPSAVSARTAPVPICPAGARAPEEDASRGPRVSVSRTQPRGVFQAGHRSHLPQPHPGHMAPQSPPAAGVTSPVAPAGRRRSHAWIYVSSAADGA